MEQQKKPKMLIIDGSSVLTTCYYANLPLEVKMAKTDEEKEESYRMILHAADGTYTNGILGFCKILVRFIRDWQPDYIVTAFDKSRATTFRKKMYPDYKGQRKKTPEPLKEQMNLIHRILAECCIPVLISDQYEADDLAGSVVKKYKESTQIMLLTKDRDYLQLVDDKNDVRCLIMTEEQSAEQFRMDYGLPRPELYCFRNVMEFNSARVQSEKGVLPESITDLKALVGDASDNIPGVRGISSAAAPLISHYKTIDALYADIKKDMSKKALKSLSEKWKEDLDIKRSPMNALIAGEKDAYLSKDLASIRTNIVLPDLLAFPTSRFATNKFNSWMEKLDIKSIRL